MHLKCQLDRHQSSAFEVWNDGHFFSFCELCGTDLTRRPGGRWHAVRAPHKVVWKPRQPFDLPWLPNAVPEPPADDVPVRPEWRALIDRSRRTPPRQRPDPTGDAPARGLRATGPA